MSYREHPEKGDVFKHLKRRFVRLLTLIALFGITGSPVAVPGEATDDRPNVLFIAIDDLNDWIGCMNNTLGVKTPNLDALAEMGVLFTNAHCSQAVCAASRNSVLSGLHPATTGWYASVGDMRMTYEETMKGNLMLPQYFRINGYKTMAAGKIFHNGVSDYPDLTYMFWDEYAPSWWDSIPVDIKRNGYGYGGNMFYPFPEGGGQLIRHFGPSYNKGHSLCGGPLAEEDIPQGEMYDERIAKWGVEQLKKDQEKPFLLALGFIRPHVPYTAPAEFFDLYEPDSLMIPDVPLDEMKDIPVMGKAIAFGMTQNGDHHDVLQVPGLWNELLHSYLASISFMDAQVGKVLDALNKSKYANNTVIVLWSDHGQHLGEKKHWRKQALWQESTQVPLIIAVPSMDNAGKRCSRAVTLLDLYPTLTDLCGLPQNNALQGNSLTRLIKDPDSDWPYYALTVWRYKNYSVTGERWRYIKYRDGTEELYDHLKDPGEHINLANDDRYIDVKLELQKQLPLSDALPAGMEEWEGDQISRMIDRFKSSGIPRWLE